MSPEGCPISVSIEENKTMGLKPRLNEITLWICVEVLTVVQNQTQIKACEIYFLLLANLKSL